MDYQNLKPIQMDIKVLGTGCPKCKALEKATREAVDAAGISASVSKVEDIVEIMNYGVMTTPALVPGIISTMATKRVRRAIEIKINCRQT